MKLFIKLLTLWTCLMVLTSLYGEYIINREVDYFLQIILTMILFISIFWSINLTIKLLTKKQEKND
jgi:predicted transglutaminase-like protease